MLGNIFSAFAQARALKQQQKIQQAIYEYHKESYRRTIPQYKGWLTAIDEPMPQGKAPVLLIEDKRKGV